MARYEEQRNFLKSDFKTFSAIETDKQKGIPQPPNVKAYDADAEIVDLPAVDGGVVKKENIYEIIKERRSVRHYAKDALTMDELVLPVVEHAGHHGHQPFRHHLPHGSMQRRDAFL